MDTDGEMGKIDGALQSAPTSTEVIDPEPL